MSKYFKEIEYKMDKDFLAKLDDAREFAGFPFFINSAYRSPDHPESIKNPTSSHIKGLAVDIRARLRAQSLHPIEQSVQCVSGSALTSVVHGFIST